jgi:hypothetical protein
MRAPRPGPLLADLLCVASELFTGKSLPALLVLVHRPLDRVPAVVALAVGALRQFQQQLFDELVEVVDLLELAPRVLVELAVAGEDVQMLEQGDGLAGAQ